MRHTRIKKQLEAIRQAKCDAPGKTRSAHMDDRSWLGLGLKAALNPIPRFRGEDDLWVNTGNPAAAILG